MAFDFLLILFMFFSPFAFLVIGEVGVSSLARVFGTDAIFRRSDEFDVPVLFVFGLLLYLFFALVLKMLGAHWAIASLVPIAPIFFNRLCYQK